MTQMPQLTMSYDVANRMTTSNHASAGTQSYGYNHANQRVFVRNGNTVTYYLYGLGGERLMEFQETCTGGACTSYTETQRWIYFAGRKMFQKTGTTLKAITPNRLASEAKHFPYGETDGTPPTDTKDYFATYRRDGTGLDYAWNRYYSPTMGRFTTADPYGGSALPSDPQSWNRYTYSLSNPVLLFDPDGLAPCPPNSSNACIDVFSGWEGLLGSFVDESRAYGKKDRELGIQEMNNLAFLAGAKAAHLAMIAFDLTSQITQFSRRMNELMKQALTDCQPFLSERLAHDDRAAIGRLSGENSAAPGVEFLSPILSGGEIVGMYTGLDYNRRLTVAELAYQAEAAPNPAAALAMGNSANRNSGAIVVLRGFWELPPDQRSPLIVHELLHIATGEYDDVSLARDYFGYSGSDSAAASSYITNHISQFCDGRPQ